MMLLWLWLLLRCSDSRRLELEPGDIAGNSKRIVVDVEKYNKNPLKKAITKRMKERPSVAAVAIA